MALTGIHATAAFETDVVLRAVAVSIALPGSLDTHTGETPLGRIAVAVDVALPRHAVALSVNAAMTFGALAVEGALLLSV